MYRKKKIRIFIRNEVYSLQELSVYITRTVYITRFIYITRLVYITRSVYITRVVYITCIHYKLITRLPILASVLNEPAMWLGLTTRTS